MSSKHRHHLKQYLQSHKNKNENEKSNESVGNQVGKNTCSCPPKYSGRSSTSNSSNTIRETPIDGRAKPRKEQFHRKLTLHDLPDELLLYVFRFLGINDLLLCGCVCKRWLNVASDNVTWKKLYTQHAVQTANTKQAKIPETAHCSYWKTECIQRCSAKRTSRALSYLKKVHPYTGLSAGVDKAIVVSSIRWQVALITSDNREIVFMHNDVFYFLMSVCVRWYSLNFPVLSSVSHLKLYSVNPVFFDKKGQCLPNSPCQRSLLLDINFREALVKAETLDTFERSDDLIAVHILEEGIALATWKEGGEIAFISVNFPRHNLISRCLLGNTSSTYSPQTHKVVPDDASSSYGLTGFCCTLELRNQRKSIWNQKFDGLFCKREDLDAGFANFQLISERYDAWYGPIEGKLDLPWKTELFKGIIKDLCILDVTVLDDRKEPMICTSKPVNIVKPTNSVVDYDFEGETMGFSLLDKHCQVQARIQQDGQKPCYRFSHLDLMISLELINSWFGTAY